MTLQRFLLAVLCFHSAVVALAGLFLLRWRNPAMLRLPFPRWVSRLAVESLALATAAYLCSVGAAIGANLGYELGRVQVGPISLRLLGQALFIELPLLAGLLAIRSFRISPLPRTVALALVAVALGAVHVDAYYIEPRMIVPREYAVDRTQGTQGGPSIRILHLTDIQTPTIGAHEEDALRLGLSYKPDLIVMTGDYVQNALGRDTERKAARDLVALMDRIGFDAPLGVFATEGDVGPPCREVFQGSRVRCLSDESMRVPLRGGSSLVITGLTRGRGRDRDAARLNRVVGALPTADYRIVISHAPDFIDSLTLPIDLALAGHTHGGQVVIPWFGPPKTAIRLPRKYAGGLNQFNGTPIHVSRGIGMERGFDIPVRFLCPPEIGIIDLLLPYVR